MAVAAAMSSAEPVPPSMGIVKLETKTVSAAREIDPRPVQLSAVAMEAETRATNLPGGAESPYILIHGLCVRKSSNSVEVRGSPPKTACSVRGTSPPKAMLSARGTGHKLTQGSFFGAEHEPTQGSAFGAGHEPTQRSACGVGH